MLSRINGWQLFIIILAVIILIGWKRLPDAARSLGRSLRIFKSEVEQLGDKDDPPSAASRDTVDGAHRFDPGTRPLTGEATVPRESPVHRESTTAPEDTVRREGTTGEPRP